MTLLDGAKIYEFSKSALCLIWPRYIVAFLMMFSLSTQGSIIRDAENGVHIYCKDMDSSVIATYQGLSIGLNGNGIAFPYSEGHWISVPGYIGCFSRPMSQQTQTELMNAIYYYCVTVKRNCVSNN